MLDSIRIICNHARFWFETIYIRDVFMGVIS